ESLSVCNLDGGRFLGQNSSCTPDSCTGGQTSLAVSIGNLVLDDARLVINTPTGNGASSVSAGTLILRGDSSVEGVGGAKVVVDADGCIFGFGATSTLNNVCETVTGPGPCELGFGTAVHLQEGASLAFDGRGGTVPNACFVGPGFAIDSADGTGSLAADFVDFLLGETTDPTTPSQTIDVPFVATNSNVTASCSGCPGRANAQFLSGLTLEGTCGFDGVDVTVQPGLTIGPDGVWTLTDANVLTGTLDNETVMSTVLTSSTLAIQVLSLSSAAIGGKTLSLQDSQVRFLNADGTSELGSLTGTITLSKDILENPPQIPFVVTINAFVSTTTVKSGTILAPGDTISAPGGIGTATISADEVVVEPGTVLEVDIDPTNAVDPNDVLQFVSGGATVGTNMRIFLKSESECGIAPPDAFTIVTGTAITYPNGGDGRRILTAGGEGSFVVNQGPTGIVLDGFLLGADINGDRAVDDADAHLLIPCLAGPGEPHSPGCDTSDLDFDADTDLKDFSVIQNGFGTTCP
ncbi:MAG: hypothetical protein ACE5EX_00785, partial [Phycisphaerae bacterium]